MSTPPPANSGSTSQKLITPKPLVLASGSPQRRAILERLGISFEVVVSPFEEVEVGADPESLAIANARGKALAVAALGHDPVLGADTVVGLGGMSLGSPATPAAAVAMLNALSGSTHEVCTAIVLVNAGTISEAVVRVTVRVREVTPEMVAWYVQTDEWRGRAGGYAIQGRGSALIEEVRGDFSAVVGLPVAALTDLLTPLGRAPWDGIRAEG